MGTRHREDLRPFPVPGALSTNVPISPPHKYDVGQSLATTNTFRLVKVTEQNRPGFTWVTAVLLLTLTSLPWLMLGAFLYLAGQPVTAMYPVLSDEVSIFTQVEAFIHYGQPVGYYGYGGSTAAVGTGGPWGQAFLWPYGLFGSVFGWYPFSPVLANTTFVSLSLLIFAILTRPSTRSALFLVCAYLGCFSLNVSTLTGMAEPLRVSTALVMLGLLYRLVQHRNPGRGVSAVGKVLDYVVAPVFIIFAAQVYLPLVLGMGMYVFFSVPSWTLMRKLVTATGATVALGAATYAAFTTFSAPYFRSHAQDVLAEITTSGWDGVVFAFTRAADHVVLLTQVNPHAALDLLVIAQMHLLLIALVALAIATKHRRVRFRRSAHDSSIGAIGIITLAGMYLACIFLYTGWQSIAARQFTAVLVPTVLLLCLADRKWVASLFLVAAMAFAPFAAHSVTGHGTDRFRADTQVSQHEQLNRTLAETIRIDTTADRWENTIAIYGPFSSDVIHVPAGAGLNYFAELPPDIDTRPRYAMITIGASSAKNTARTRLEGVGYSKTLDLDSVVVMERP